MRLIQFILATFIICSANLLRAQDFGIVGLEQDIPRDTFILETFDMNLDIESQLLPLDSLVRIAIENNPVVKFEEHLAESDYYNYRNSKRLWTNSFALYGQASAGDQTVQLVDPSGGSNQTNISNGYQVGVSLRVPLYEFIGRQHYINQAKYEWEASLSKADIARMDISRLVIEEYYNLIAAQRQFMFASDDAQTQETNLHIAELELRHNRIEPAEYARLHNLRATAQSTLEERRRNLYAQFFRFEQLIGVQIQFLKRR